MQSKESAKDLAFQKNLGMSAEDQDENTERTLPSSGAPGWYLRQEIGKAIMTQWENMENEVLGSLFKIFRSMRYESTLSGFHYVL